MLHRPIIIVGGGPIGLTTALLLARSGREVTVLDAGNSKASDGRVLALSYASMDLLNELNAWPHTRATAINQVHISHSGLGVTRMLAEDVNLPQLGYTIKYADICAQLNKEVSQCSNIQLKTCIVEEVISGKSFATLGYRGEHEIEYITTDLAILAEGGKIKINDVSYTEHSYEQHAIIAEIKTQKPHANIAYERFDNSGAMVLLPHNSNYTLVWSLPSNEVEQIITDKSLSEKLAQLSFIKRFGKIEVGSAVHSFPLKLQVAKTRVLDKVVLIGNSAQTVHPVSAQGMNLGLRDARVLCECMSSPSSENNITEFNQSRAEDAKLVIGFTHSLARFIDKPQVSHLRGAGIVALSNCKTLQNFIANSLIFGA